MPEDGISCGSQLLNTATTFMKQLGKEKKANKYRNINLLGVPNIELHLYLGSFRLLKPHF